MRPSVIRTSREALAATDGSWVIRTTVWPNWLDSRRRRRRILLAGRDVEVPGRLVGQQHGGLVRERAGDRDPLLLAARQLRGQVVAPSGEPDRVEQRVGSGAALAVLDPVGASAASTFSRAVSVGIRLNCWNTNPNVSSRSRASAASPSRDRSRPSKSSSPRGRAVEPAQQLEQRRLAGAARAGDDEELAGVHVRSTR